MKKEKKDGCGWGKCVDCGVIPLLYKLHKGQLLEDNEAKRTKEEILKAREIEDKLSEILFYSWLDVINRNNV